MTSHPSHRCNHGPRLVSHRVAQLAAFALIAVMGSGARLDVAAASSVAARDCGARFALAAPGVLAAASPEARVGELMRLIVEAYRDALNAGVVRLEEVDELVFALEGAPIGAPSESLWRVPGLDGLHVGARQALREQLAGNLRPAFESDYFESAQRTEIVAQVVRELREEARARRENREEARQTVETVREINERVSIGGDGLEHVWRRVTDPEIVAKLGESWQDDSGMIWGDVVRNDDHSIRRMNQYEAEAYCKSIGMRLPTREDLIRLRESMGATTVASDYSGKGYKPQVMPSLDSATNIIWSSSVYASGAPGSVVYAYGLQGSSGSLYTPRCIDFGVYATRCVVRR